MWLHPRCLPTATAHPRELQPAKQSACLVSKMCDLTEAALQIAEDVAELSKLIR